MISLNGHIYLSFDDVLSYGLPQDTVKSGMRRHRDEGIQSWVNIPDPADSRRKLILLDSIPPATRAKYHIPDAGNMVTLVERENRAAAVDVIRRAWRASFSQADMDFYTASGRPVAEAHSLATSAALMRLLSVTTGKRMVATLDAPGIVTKEQLWDVVIELIKTDKPRGLHKVNTLGQLRRKFSRWNNESLTHEGRLGTLIHGLAEVKGVRAPEPNRLKVKPWVRAVLMDLYMNLDSTVKLCYSQLHAAYEHRRITEEYVFDEESAERKELPELGLSTVKDFLTHPSIKPLDRFRHGQKYYRDTIRPYVLGKAPEYAWSMTSSDGQTCPFVLNTGKGKYDYKRPTVYLIFEVHSQAVVGMAFGMQETADLAVAAFQDMLLRSNGIVPMENQMDNFLRKNLDINQVARRMGMALHFCQPYNPQSKYAESLINAFENAHLANVEGWVGKGIGTKRADSHRNPDLPKVTYTLQDIEAIYREAAEAWNASAPVKSRRKVSRLELLGEVNPGAQRMDQLTLATVAGRDTIRKIERGFVRLEVNKTEYTYTVPDYTSLLPELRNDYRVRLRWIPGDPSQVYLFNFDGAQASDLSRDRYLCAAPLADRTQRARAEQTDEDGARLGRFLKRGVEMDEYTENLAREATRWTHPSRMTRQEAETIMDSGYTDKYLMQEAEAALDQDEDNTSSTTTNHISRWRRK